MLGNGPFATGFGTFGLLRWRVATDELVRTAQRAQLIVTTRKVSFSPIVMIYGAIHPFSASRLCPAFRAQLAAKPIA